MRLLFSTVLTLLLAAISSQAMAQIEAPAPYYPALVPTLGGANLWGGGGNNFEQGCPISAVGSPGTFTPNCAVNFITITAAGQTIAAPTFTIPTGATASLVKKSIELVITYSGNYMPTFASAPAYAWPIGSPPVQCSTTVTVGCLSASSSAGPDWVECRSNGTSGHVGCALPITSMGVVPASYAGPGDIISGASAWWGLRAYSAAVAATGTQKAINIRRASDSTTTDILILTSGVLDVATATTFCAATTCTVTKMYDQSGNGLDLSQATVGNQPSLTFNCVGSYPCLTGTISGGTIVASATITVIPQPLTMSIVAERTVVNTTGFDQVIGGSGAAQVGFNQNVANSIYSFAGSIVAETANDNAFHTMQAVMSDAAAASAINLDGTEFTGISVGTSPTFTQFIMWSSDCDCKVTEAGVWPLAFSSGNRSSINTNQHAFYGF